MVRPWATDVRQRQIGGPREASVSATGLFLPWGGSLSPTISPQRLAWFVSVYNSSLPGFKLLF